MPARFEEVKIFLLADGGSPHTIKWAKSLAQSGHEIFIFGLARFDTKIYQDFKNIHSYSFGLPVSLTKSGNGSLRKVSYLMSIFKLWQHFFSFKPDIVHVHFVSSYGLLGAFVPAKKIYMSVWGADVYDFPEKGIIYRWLLQFTLLRATTLFSTSKVMAKQVSKFTSKQINVIPFGVDPNRFSPQLVSRMWPEEYLIIGTIKSLEEKYGISDLIKAFSLIRDTHPEKKIKLLIGGIGSKESDYKKLVNVLGINEDVKFTGWIGPELITEYHNQIDIPVFPSIRDSESFGVAVVEACACEKPVIVSRKGGLTEVVEENVTGLVVPAEDPHALAEAILKLINSSSLRQQFGKAGRERVLQHYNWENNVQSMNSFYQ